MSSHHLLGEEGRHEHTADISNGDIPHTGYSSLETIGLPSEDVGSNIRPATPGKKGIATFFRLLGVGLVFLLCIMAGHSLASWARSRHASQEELQHTSPDMILTAHKTMRDESDRKDSKDLKDGNDNDQDGTCHPRKKTGKTPKPTLTVAELEAMCGVSAGQVRASNGCTKDICADKTAFLNDPACATSMGRDGYLVLEDLFLSNCMDSVVDLKEIYVVCGEVRMEEQWYVEELDLSRLVAVNGSIYFKTLWGLRMLDMSGLELVGDEFWMNENFVLTSLEMSNLRSVGLIGGGFFNFRRQWNLHGCLDLGLLEHVGGYLDIDQNPSIKGLDLSSLLTVGLSNLTDDGYVELKSMYSLLEADLSSLHSVGYRFRITSAESIGASNPLEKLDISSLANANINPPSFFDPNDPPNAVEIEDCRNLESVELPGMSNLRGGLRIQDNSNLKQVKLANIESITGDVTIGNNYLLEEVDLASVRQIQDLNVNVNYLLRSINFRSLENITTRLRIRQNYALDFMDLRNLERIGGETYLVKTKPAYDLDSSDDPRIATCLFGTAKPDPVSIPPVPVPAPCCGYCDISPTCEQVCPV